MRYKRKIHCQFCDTYFLEPDAYARHLETEHSDFLPEDFDGWRYYYYQKTGKMKGSCVMCKQETRWNDVTHKYNRFCDNPACKDKYREEFKKRMIGKYGKVTLLDDPEQQKKMLANRRISGLYSWSDDPRIKILYTGSYEKEFLEFLDLDLHFDPKDIISHHLIRTTMSMKVKNIFIFQTFLSRLYRLKLKLRMVDPIQIPTTRFKMLIR